MSEENVELVRDLLEAFRRRDHERAFDFYDPDIEWDATTKWGRHSGVVTDIPPYGLVFTIRSGKVVRWRIFPDHQSALDAAGLRE